MSQDAKKLLITIQKHLNIVFGNSQLTNELSKNNDFANVIQKQIALCNNLEKMLPDADKLTLKFAENYQRIKKSDIDFVKYEKITDLDEITDEINYLNVFCKNTFNKQLDEFDINVFNDPNANRVESSKDEEPLRGEKISKDAFEQKIHSTNSNPNPTPPPFNASNFYNPSMADISNLKAGFYKTMACERLNAEIECGKVYRWKEKLRSVYILQFVAVAASLLYALAGIALVCGWIYAYTQNILQQVNVPTQNQGTTMQESKVSLLWVLLPSVLLIGMSISMAFRYFNDSQGRTILRRGRRMSMVNQNQQTDKPKCNDNVKYYFRISYIVYNAVLYVLFGMIPTYGATQPLSFVLYSNSFLVGGVPGIQATPILAIYILSIIFLASFAPLVVVAVVGKLLNPKEDTEKIQSLLNDYMREAEMSNPFDMK